MCDVFEEIAHEFHVDHYIVDQLCFRDVVFNGGGQPRNLPRNIFYQSLIHFQADIEKYLVSNFPD